MSDIANIVVSVSAVVTAGVAVYGVRSWRKEMTGRARFEIARKLMFEAIKVREDFSWARFPLSSSEEYVGRPKAEDESPKVTMVLNDWHVRRRRTEALNADFRQLQSIAWEAEVVLDDNTGSDIRQLVLDLRGCYGELVTAIDYHFRERQREALGTALNTDPQWLDGLRKVVYSSSGDDFSKRVEETVARLGDVLKEFTLTGGSKPKNPRPVPVTAEVVESPIDLSRSWILSQATASFLLSFVFLRSLTLNTSSGWTLSEWTGVTLGLATLIFAYLLVPAVLVHRLRPTALRLLSSPISIVLGMAFVGSFLLNWLQGLEPLPGVSGILYQVFFYAGFLWFVLLEADFIWRAFHQNRGGSRAAGKHA